MQSTTPVSIPLARAWWKKRKDSMSVGDDASHEVRRGFQSTPATIFCAKASTQLYFLKKWAGLAADQFRHFYLSTIGLIVKYCSVVWHHGLTKAQVEQLEAVQRRAARIIFEVTVNIMPYQSVTAYANISSSHVCREDLNKKNS